MSYVTRPAAAPGCWGSKYQDGDVECGQCKYRDSCREELLNRVVNPQANRTALTVMRNYSPSVAAPPPPPPPPSISFASTQSAVVPLPSKPYYPPPVSSLPNPRTTPALPQTSAPQATTPQVSQPQYYQQSTGWSLPSTANPNPMAPMFRPGAPGPAYYFTQYPGETVATRVGKNAVLRMAEALFGELMQFFRHWTWPPQ